MDAENTVYSYKLIGVEPSDNMVYGPASSNPDGSRSFRATYEGYTYLGSPKGKTSVNLGVLLPSEATAAANEKLNEMNAYAQRKYQAALQRDAENGVGSAFGKWNGYTSGLKQRFGI